MPAVSAVAHSFIDRGSRDGEAPAPDAARNDMPHRGAGVVVSRTVRLEDRNRSRRRTDRTRRFPAGWHPGARVPSKQIHCCLIAKYTGSGTGSTRRRLPSSDEEARTCAYPEPSKRFAPHASINRRMIPAMATATISAAGPCSRPGEGLPWRACCLGLRPAPPRRHIGRGGCRTSRTCSARGSRSRRVRRRPGPRCSPSSGTASMRSGGRFWEHTATHLDAPGHFVPGGRLAPELDPSELMFVPAAVIDITAKARPESGRARRGGGPAPVGTSLRPHSAPGAGHHGFGLATPGPRPGHLC